MNPVIDIGVDFTFEAAHWLPNVPPDHKCRNMHGHSYKVTVTITGQVNNDGMVLDYANIKAATQPIINLLDHHTVNDIIENSTAENLAIWLWNQLRGLLPVSAVTVYETATTHCTYRGN